jgi:DNA-binding phage protein
MEVMLTKRKQALLDIQQEHLEELARLHEAVVEAEELAASSRRLRDAAMREAVAEGLTMYAIAKRLGLAQTSVAKSLAREAAPSTT